MIHFAAPWMLPLVALVIAATVALSRRLPRTMAPWRRRAWFALGVLSALSAALASAEPEYALDDDRLTVVLAVDRSRSVTLADPRDERAATVERAAMVRMRTFDRLARVAFATEAVTEDPPHARDVPTAPRAHTLSRDGSDLAAGIRRALAELPADSTGRVVLITDGAANRGDALAAAASARASGVAIDVARVAAPPRRNLRVEHLRVPTIVDERAAMDLRVVTRSDADLDVDLRVSIDGTVVRRGRAHVRAGEDVITLPETAPAPGLHRYEVELVSRDDVRDTLPEDNRAGAFVRVRGAASVLVLEGDPGASAPFARALRDDAAMRVVERGPNGFPQDLAELAGFDLVVLSDVPARALSPEQMEQLRTWVRDLGGGLLLLGGDRSLGPGGYARTPVEEIAPVSFDLRQERRRASLSEVISIDYSGSMTAEVGPYTKIQLANEAAARSAMLLGPGDRVGVAHVDTATRWTVRLGPVTDLADVVRRIRAVGAGGGGIIVPTALADGYAALRSERTNLRHLLLFADGDDAEEMPGCAETAAAAYREGITTSVVSLGRGVDTAALEELSRVGHGRFYLVEDAMRLPTVFAQETILASRASIREDRFRLTPRAPDPITAGIALNAAPPLRGYVVTLPKPRASVLASGPDDDPILAAWQVGVGRVAVFTSDFKDRWGAEWLAWPGAAQLQVSLARALVRRGDDRVRVEADADGAVLHVRASATDRAGRADGLRRLTARVSGPDGTTRDLPLDAAGGGSYVTELPLPRHGAWVVSVRDDALGATVATTGALLLASEELRTLPDLPLLQRITTLTGGRMLAGSETPFDRREGRRRAYRPLSRGLLLAALFAMLASLVVRRLALPARLARQHDRAQPPRRNAPAPVSPQHRRDVPAEPPQPTTTATAAPSPRAVAPTKPREGPVSAAAALSARVEARRVARAGTSTTGPARAPLQRSPTDAPRVAGAARPRRARDEKN